MVGSHKNTAHNNTPKRQKPPPKTTDISMFLKIWTKHTLTLILTKKHPPATYLHADVSRVNDPQLGLHLLVVLSQQFQVLFHAQQALPGPAVVHHNLVELMPCLLLFLLQEETGGLTSAPLLSPSSPISLSSVISIKYNLCRAQTLFSLCRNLCHAQSLSLVSSILSVKRKACQAVKHNLCQAQSLSSIISVKHKLSCRNLRQA